MFGLIAEDLEKVNPDLVTRDAKGEVETVRYEAVNAMLINEFMKEHRKNAKQEATITSLKAEIATLAAIVKEQASQIRKVSAQLEPSKPGSRCGKSTSTKDGFRLRPPPTRALAPHARRPRWSPRRGETRRCRRQGRGRGTLWLLRG